MEAEPVNLLSNSLDDLNLFDCEIHVEGKVLKAKKSILKENSPVFDAYFQHESIEKRTNVVKIENANVDAVESMINLMHDGSIENLNQMACEILILADRYDIDKLRKICLKELSTNINFENIFDCLIVSELLQHPQSPTSHEPTAYFQFEFEDLKTKSMEFATENLTAIMELNEWQEFSIKNNEIVVQLLRQMNQKLEEKRECCKKLCSEQEETIDELLKSMEKAATTNSQYSQYIHRLRNEKDEIAEEFRELKNKYEDLTKSNERPESICIL